YVQDEKVRMPRGDLVEDERSVRHDVGGHTETVLERHLHGRRGVRVVLRDEDSLHTTRSLARIGRKMRSFVQSLQWHISELRMQQACQSGALPRSPCRYLFGVGLLVGFARRSPPVEPRPPRSRSFAVRCSSFSMTFCTPGCAFSGSLSLTASSTTLCFSRAASATAWAASALPSLSASRSLSTASANLSTASEYSAVAVGAEPGRSFAISESSARRRSVRSKRSCMR